MNDCSRCYTFFYCILPLISRRSDCEERLFTSLCSILLLLNFIVFDRLRMPVTVGADILSSLIAFCNWFCKRAIAEADFLGSCRNISYYCIFIKEYIILYYILLCWRTNEIFLNFSLNISTLILWAIRESHAMSTKFLWFSKKPITPGIIDFTKLNYEELEELVAGGQGSFGVNW